MFANDLDIAENGILCALILHKLVKRITGTECFDLFYSLENNVWPQRITTVFQAYTTSCITWSRMSGWRPSGVTRWNPETELLGKHVFEVHKCQHTYRPGEFHYEVEIALVCLRFFCVQPKIPILLTWYCSSSLVPHAPACSSIPAVSCICLHADMGISPI